jgi:hypothetical protein
MNYWNPAMGYCMTEAQFEGRYNAYLKERRPPANRTFRPTIGNKTVSLWFLYNLVTQLGGWDCVYNNRWLPYIYKENPSWAKYTSIANRLMVIYTGCLLGFEKIYFKGKRYNTPEKRLRILQPYPSGLQCLNGAFPASALRRTSPPAKNSSNVGGRSRQPSETPTSQGSIMDMSESATSRTSSATNSPVVQHKVTPVLVGQSLPPGTRVSAYYEKDCGWETCTIVRKVPMEVDSYLVRWGVPEWQDEKLQFSWSTFLSHDRVECVSVPTDSWYVVPPEETSENPGTGNIKRRNHCRTHHIS